MLQLLDEEVCQQVNRIVHSAHELLQFDLADLDDEDGAALLVDTVEAVRTQGLDLRVLRKFKVLQVFTKCGRLEMMHEHDQGR